MSINPPDEMKREKIKFLQRADQGMTGKINYLKDKPLPDDQKRSYKVLNDIDKYFLGDLQT